MKRNKIASLKWMLLGFTLLLFLPIWFWYISPELTKIPDDFEYKVLVFSRDNFYDVDKTEFSGEFVSNTEHFYRVVENHAGILLITSRFTVQQYDGKEIFSVERTYAVDSKTRKHVPGYGDRDREGYLFAPPGLKKGQNFTYWHVNYDNPANMEYRGEEAIAGLTVYKYETNYHADQTFDLEQVVSPLSDRGVNVDINLQLWVEPVTGRKIKYEDHTTAYFYNLTTGERLHPWNRFQNNVDEISVLKQVEIAKHEKLKRFFLERIITDLIAIVAILLLSYQLFNRKQKSEQRR
ncbi:MAG: porin PorA family protein [Nanoarchaeota archaeon]|nr:porin PorA family protein [Nanoarchaeota archaeon]